MRKCRPTHACTRLRWSSCKCRVCRNVTLIHFIPSLMPLLVWLWFVQIWPRHAIAKRFTLASCSRTFISYKLCVLLYNCLHGTAPRYLQDVIQPVAEVTSCHRLRSASSLLLWYRTSNTLFMTWRKSLCGCWTTCMEQFTSVRHRLLVTSHLQEIPQDLFIYFILEHELAV